jgi:uncharacterized protein
MIFRTGLVLTFLALATPAEALDCSKAASATEHAICGSSQLTKADGELTRLYAQVRAAVAPSARAALLHQQKDWIARRDTRCGATTACLGTAYQARIGALTSLKARADAQDEPLTDITPVILMGDWHVERIVDPSGHPLPTDLSRQLAEADLPLLGAMVHAAPGKLCFGAEPCAAIGWTATTLGALQGGPRIAGDLRLPPSTRAYIGADGSKWAHQLTIIRPDDGRVLALAGLCDARGASECRNAYQIWHPVNAGSRLVQGPG